jgi:hypothetical protein
MEEWDLRFVKKLNFQGDFSQIYPPVNLIKAASHLDELPERSLAKASE